MILLVSGCAATGESGSNKELGYQGYKSSESKTPEAIQILEELKKRSEANFRNSQGWIIVNIDTAEEKAIWSFTPESHPAYPSIVKREVIQKDGSIYIDTTGSCGAEKEICDKLVQDFIDLNNKVTEEVKK